MKKAQEDQIKAGGEIARARYQMFMAKPDWMTHIRKEHLIKGLKEFIESQRAAYEAQSSWVSKILAKENSSTRELKENAERAVVNYYSLCGIHEAEALLRLFEGDDFQYQAPNIVHHDFSMYCRDN